MVAVFNGNEGMALTDHIDTSNQILEILAYLLHTEAPIS